MTDLDELIAEARRLEGDYSDSHEVVTHMSVLADAALARITDLEESLHSESLARKIDATLLHEYERRFAEAAKLHRREPGTRVGWCSHCIDNDGPWPCPTAVALGLSEGEGEKP